MDGLGTVRVTVDKSVVQMTLHGNTGYGWSSSKQGSSSNSYNLLVQKIIAPQ